MTCGCGSERLCDFGGKSSDMNYTRVGDKETDGYVPRDMGIGGGDYVEFTYCLDCGRIQGKFPLPKTELETEPEPLSEEDKVDILADIRDWIGGYDLEEMDPDDIDRYLEVALSKQYDRNLVRKWFNELLEEIE